MKKVFFHFENAAPTLPPAMATGYEYCTKLSSAGA
jgi:hypothetical protein